MSTKFGFDCKLYRATDGVRVSWGAASSDGISSGPAPGNLVEVENVKDATAELTDTEGDVSTRASKWKLIAQGLTDGSVSFQMIHDPDDADWIAFRNAKFGRYPIALAMLDGDKATVGSQGLWADFAVTGFKEGQPLDGVSMTDVTVKPTRSSVPPEWAVVSA